MYFVFTTNTTFYYPYVISLHSTTYLTTLYFDVSQSLRTSNYYVSLRFTPKCYELLHFTTVISTSVRSVSQPIDTFEEKNLEAVAGVEVSFDVEDDEE